MGNWSAKLNSRRQEKVFSTQKNFEHLFFFSANEIEIEKTAECLSRPFAKQKQDA